MGNVGTVFEQTDVKAITENTVFPGCVYRLEGSVLTYSGNLGVALNRHSALNVGVEQREGESQNLDYSNTVIRGGFSYSY